MRAYFWGNMYMSSIQQGIQSLHCLSEMYCKYIPGHPEAEKRDILYNWAGYHKTVIVLGGGEMLDLSDIGDLFKSEDNPFPYAEWNESASALNNALTCVGIVVSEEIVEAVAEMRASKRERRRVKFARRLNDFEFDLVKLIFYSHMAR